MKKYSISTRHPERTDKKLFILAMEASESFHYPWIEAPRSTEQFNAYLAKYDSDHNISYLVMADDLIAGVININEIVRGCFQSAFLGYFGVAKFAGQGIMREGMLRVIQAAFNQHGLHRLEANIQPENAASINLVKRCGFEKEGYSKEYLRINGEWKDHERWAIRKEMLAG